MARVINQNGELLAPCNNVIARLLLKDEKAQVYRKNPFTIQLAYNVDVDAYCEDKKPKNRKQIMLEEKQEQERNGTNIASSQEELNKFVSTVLKNVFVSEEMINTDYNETLMLTNHFASPVMCCNMVYFSKEPVRLPLPNRYNFTYENFCEGNLSNDAVFLSVLSDFVYDWVIKELLLNKDDYGCVVVENKGDYDKYLLDDKVNYIIGKNFRNHLKGNAEGYADTMNFGIKKNFSDGLIYPWTPRRDKNDYYLIIKNIPSAPICKCHLAYHHGIVSADICPYEDIRVAETFMFKNCSQMRPHPYPVFRFRSSAGEKHQNNNVEIFHFNVNLQNMDSVSKIVAEKLGNEAILWIFDNYEKCDCFTHCLGVPDYRAFSIGKNYMYLIRDDKDFDLLKQTVDNENKILEAIKINNAYFVVKGNYNSKTYAIVVCREDLYDKQGVFKIFIDFEKDPLNICGDKVTISTNRLKE